MGYVITQAQNAVSAAQKGWGWFLALGIGLIALGAAAIYYEGTATVAAVIVLGSIILLGGVLEIAAAFQARGAGHVILYLLLGALEIIVGFVLVADPTAGALAVTLVLSVYLMFAGVLRIVYSLWAQFPFYGWAVFGGLVTLALGVLLFLHWPVTAFWFLGFAVGVNFIIAGALWSAFALRLKTA